MDRAGRVAAQAKINLALRVLAREVSGYHQIETLFCRIALADTVVVRIVARERSLDCHGADLGPIEANLAYRAAAAYAAARGWPDGFAIEIEKRIPVGGGLGGGSADAEPYSVSFALSIRPHRSTTRYSPWRRHWALMCRS
jgi:4-diphosphocytidyl-2-C-methyl-D-erythritol kinase